MADSKFASPTVSKDVDQGKFLKLAQRVEKALSDEVLHKEPEQLDPSLILIAPLNRQGAPPNVQHIHFVILKGMLQKGFDRTRPAVGICAKFVSEEGKAELLRHNHRFTKGNKLLPLSTRTPSTAP